MSDTSPKPFVFVLMPFEETFSDIYLFGIKAACQEAGAYCERVDEQIFSENILDRIYNQIAKADIIISEMTGRNPNVFYETGYAHALNKRVILLTQNAFDIPFDLKQYPHVVYDGRISVLKAELEKRVRWCIENPTLSLATPESKLKFLINGVPLDNEPEIQIQYFDDVEQYGEKKTGNRAFLLTAEVYNPTDKKITAEWEDMGFVIPANFWVDDDYTVSQKSRLGVINLFRHSSVILPEASDTRAMRFVFKDIQSEVTPVNVIFRRYTHVETIDYPFKIYLTGKSNP